MSITENAKAYFRAFRHLAKSHKAQKTEAAKVDHTAAELIRHTHSIEKGLSIANPRPGFGEQKHKEMMEGICALAHSPSPYHREACGMALCAMRAYVDYHVAKGYANPLCDKLAAFVEMHKDLLPADMAGGIMCLERTQLTFDVPAIERFFKTRHSIRDFAPGAVDATALKKALELAQRAPSACNRQGVRAYVLNGAQKTRLQGQLTGIGGFADEVDTFLLITGKQSAYRSEEDSQYIVSASMYAAYLTLTLHLYGLGACVVQRPVLWTAEWEANRRAFGIPADEQVVCLLAVGNLKDTCTVPLSHRMEHEDMMRFL